MTIKKGTSTIATTGSTTWGGLEGTLSDQTDLQNALDAKASTLSPAFSGVPTAPTAQEGTNTTQIATTAFVKAAVDNIDALPDQTDMSGKYLATDGVNAFWKSPAGLPLLSHLWSDHLLNDASFLRADTFSWQNGNVYKSAYEHLVDDIDGITATTETIGSYTVTYYPCADGHKIVLANQETTVMNIYDESGIAWYYILDTANTRFKLPRTKWGFVGYRDAVGKYVEPGLPNIVGNFDSSGFLDSSFVGCFSKAGEANDRNLGGGNTFGWKGVGFNASLSSSIYGNSTTVQPPATQMYLYFYVGNFVRNETEIDVGEITEALDGKLDQDLSNASSSFKETIVGYGMPDYSAGISKTTNANTEWSAPSNGFVSVYKQVPNTSTSYYVYVNNQVVGYGISIECQSGMSTIFPVKKNDVIKYNIAVNSAVFYPCIGG